MIKTGIHSCGYLGRLKLDGYEEVLKKIKSHGYDCIDYSELSSPNSPLYAMSETDYEKYLRAFGETAKSVGLEICQMHGLWPTFGDTTDDGKAKTFEYFVKEIYAARFLGCPKLVLHPRMPKGWGGGEKQEVIDANVQLLQDLLPYARENSVTLCLENMPLKSDRTFSTVEEWKAVLETVNDPLAKACLDTGHLSAMGVDLYDAVVQMGDYIVAMHVHDDRFGQDRHLPPFQGNLNWAGFIKGLKAIHFDGCISLETEISLSTPEPMRERMQIELANVARYIADEIEK